MSKHKQTTLERALRELLECEIGVVPTEAGIREKFTFSEKFLERMNELIRRQDMKEGAARQEKKSGKNRDGNFLKSHGKMIAACVVCVIVAGVCVGVLQMDRGSDSSRMEMSQPAETDTAEEAHEEEAGTAGDTYDEGRTGEDAGAGAASDENDADAITEEGQISESELFSQVTKCNAEEVTISFTNQTEEDLSMQLTRIYRAGDTKTSVFEEQDSDMFYLVEAGSTEEFTLKRSAYGIQEAGTYVFEWSVFEYGASEPGALKETYELESYLSFEPREDIFDAYQGLREMYGDDCRVYSFAEAECVNPVRLY